MAELRCVIRVAAHVAGVAAHVAGVAAHASEVALPIVAVPVAVIRKFFLARATHLHCLSPFYIF